MPDPRCQCLSESRLRRLPNPRDVTVGPNQHRRWSRNRADRRQRPGAVERRVDQLYAIRPSREVHLASFAEVEQHGPRVAHLRVGTLRAGGRHDIEIGHAASKQRMAGPEVVVNVETGHHRGDAPARLVQAEDFFHRCAATIRSAA
ncbi:MAG: hypothetical protein H0X44_08355 [Acidobacteria bacterium]|nr:hypothetical protein [Acidobacteriota bacterium]